MRSIGLRLGASNSPCLHHIRGVTQAQRGTATPLRAIMDHEHVRASNVEAPPDEIEPRERTLQALDIPPPDPPLSVRVDHFTVPRDGNVLEVLAQLLGYPQPFVARLIDFGSVWYSHVLPKPKDMATLSETQLKEWERAREPGMLKWGRGTEWQTPRRVSSCSMPVYEGGYIRAHVHPKRFGAVHHVPDWRARVLAITEHYVVVDKPPGVQVPPTVGNIQESLLACVEKALGYVPGSLSPPHRLDAGTQGCVVLSRTPAFSRYFQELMKEKEGQPPKQLAVPQQTNKQQQQTDDHSPQPQHTQDPLQHQILYPPSQQQQQRQSQQHDQCQQSNGTSHSSEHSLPQQSNVTSHSPDHSQPLQPELSLTPTSRVRKSYRCITAKPPPLGLVTHWVLQGVREVGCMAHTLPLPEGQPPPPEAKWCALEVMQVETVRLSQEASECWQVESGAVAYQSTVRLITGRTHQIRAQFAALNHPLLGDKLYEALALRWKSKSESRQRMLSSREMRYIGDVGQRMGDRTEGVEMQGTVASAGREAINADETTAAPLQGDTKPAAVVWDPSQPLGLQAWQFEILENSSFFPSPTVFQAGTPWFADTSGS